MAQATRPHIGTLREKPLHASLKRWYATAGDRFEVEVEGFVVDVVRADLLIEVQTRGFRFMKQKVMTLLDRGYRMRILHPIPVDKWIVKVDAQDVVLSRRRSPRHGSPTDLFMELVSFPTLLTHPGLEIELILTEEEELRRHTPGRAWRRKGWTIEERRLLEVVDTRLISDAADLAALLPPDLEEPFTTADLAQGLGRPRREAQQMAYCLRLAQVITPVGKSGNAVQYRLEAVRDATTGCTKSAT